MNWDEQARADALAAAEAREPGYYWVRLHEPDGPPEWEVGNFTKIDGGKPRWYFCGSPHPRQEVAQPFSNAWEIGPRIMPPVS